MFDSVRMTFKVVFFPCLRTGIAAPLRDTVFVPVVFYLCSSFRRVLPHATTYQ